MLTRRSVFVVALLASVVAPASAQVIGTIVDAEGTWCDNAHLQCGAIDFHGLWKMYRVQMDSKLVRLGQVNGRESIQIRSRWGVLERFDCSNPRELGCKDPLDLTRLVPAQKKETVLTAFFDAIFALASDKPTVYNALLQGILPNRGLRGVVADGVAKLQQGGIGVESILKDWEAGDYLIELCPLNEDAEPKCPVDSAPVSYHWDPRRPTAFPAENLHPGLYRMFLSQNQLGATVSSGDVLIADLSQYDELQRDFQRVADATRDWDSTDPTAPTLRRIYLHALARK